MYIDILNVITMVHESGEGENWWLNQSFNFLGEGKTKGGGLLEVTLGIEKCLSIFLNKNLKPERKSFID